MDKTATLKAGGMLGSLVVSERETPFAGAAWYLAENDCGGIAFAVPAGGLPPARFVSIDMLIGGEHFATFGLRLWSGDAQLLAAYFSVLNWSQTRITRELPAGLDVSTVDRAELFVSRKPAGPLAFAAGPLVLAIGRPPRLEHPALPRGPILDEMGQATYCDWPTRTPSVDALTARLRADDATCEDARWPSGYSAWGGDTTQRVAGTGFFRTHHDGRRWWLVDPDGCLFWSAGTDCVHPTIDHEARYETASMNLREALSWIPTPDGPYAAALGHNPWHRAEDKEINFLQANFMRAFGADNWRQKWERMVFAEMRRLGFNTAGDWSDEPACSRARFPYCRALELGLKLEATPTLFDQFPDVYHDGFELDAARFAEQLRPTVDDPSMVGYFMQNEPRWHFGDGFVTPAEEMLRRNASGVTRTRLVEFLRHRHGTDGALAEAWGMSVTFDQVAQQPVPAVSEAARRDLESFSTVLLERLITVLSEACRAVDPNHLDLGVRWWTFPPLWALAAMASVDVISFNYYQPKLAWVSYLRDRPDPRAEAVLNDLNKPVLVGEWHVGCLGQGLPSAGLYGATDPEQRAQAFRVYQESAAANPWCVGAHWFNLYDRTALYCPECNENYHIGFLDITHRRHEASCRAAAESHQRLYAVARGDEPPYDVPVSYMFPSR